ncbi:hypothetical protein ACQ4PT_049218 [Festuca glaucescens]
MEVEVDRGEVARRGGAERWGCSTFPVDFDEYVADVDDERDERGCGRCAKMVGTDPPEAAGSSSGQQQVQPTGPIAMKQKVIVSHGHPPNRKKNKVVPAKTGDAGVQKETSTKQKEKEAKKKKDSTDEIRNRASPSRFFALNGELVADQRIAILKMDLGGLLNIGACTMPVDLSQWVMKCYDHVKSELVIPNRGKIPVDAESVSRVWGLPNSGLKVCYEMKMDIIKAINEEYGFPGTNAPEKTAWCKMIKDMNGAADDRFLQAWAIVAFDCFLAPTTGLKVSPRCYPAVNDIKLLPQTNICQFVANQIRVAFSALGNKKSVCCCVFHLVMLYLDSLEVDEVISDCNPRVDAWDSSLISKVKKKDRISPGVFGKLQKKRKIGALLYGLCSEFEESMAKFVQGIGNLEQLTTHTNFQHSSNQFFFSAKFLIPLFRVNREEDDDDSENDNNDDNQGDAEDDGEQREDADGEEDEVEGNGDNDEEEEEQGDDDDFDGKGGDDGDDDSDGDGGNNAATGMQGGQNDDMDDDEASDDSLTTAQYYLNTRSKRGNTSSGDKRKKKDDADVLPTTTMEDASLPDLCRIEKKSKLPDTPPTEKHVVLEERSDIIKENVSKEHSTLNATHEDGLDFINAMQCSSGAYMEFLGRTPSHRTEHVQHDEPTLVKHASAMKNINNQQPIDRQPANDARAPQHSTTILEATTTTPQSAIEAVHAALQGKHSNAGLKATSVTVTATSTSIQATNAGTEATTARPEATANPRALQRTLSVHLYHPPQQATPTTMQGNTLRCRATHAAREATAPGPVCTSPTVHATSAANKATTSTFGATSPLEHATPALQVPVVPSNRVQFSPPTRQTCPPPSPHTAPRGSLSQDEVYNLINKSIAPPDMPQHMQRSKSAETKWKEQSNYKMKLPRTRSGSELLEGYCNAPTFNLGPEFERQENQNAATCASADEDYDALEGIDPAEIERVCIATEQARRPVHEQQRTEPNSLSPNSFQTPIKEAENVATESISGGTGSSTVPHQFQRRIIKLPPCKKSPFVNVDRTKQFLCTAEVNKLYAMIIHPHIVNFGGYHITAKELANSMKPGGWLHSTVMEVGIQAITKNMTPSSNKVIMPLRIGTWMQNLDFNRPEMKELFSYERRLDKKDMVMIPVCEPLNKKAKNEPLVHHYWLLTVNMRDKRYQVLDSWRTFNDKALRETYKKIRTTLSILWEENYKKSKVQIDDFMLQEIAVPKQTNNHDCGVCTLMNADGWGGRLPPEYKAEDIPKIRKLLTHSWVTSEDNTENWRQILKI